MDIIYDLIVIGAGASGMAAAITAAERGKKVLILEKSSRAGRKILASGNGRCNLMNISGFCYHGDVRFARQVLSYCGPEDIAHFFRRLGLLLHEEEDGRIYPVTFQSASVLQALQYGMEDLGIEVRYETPVQSILRESLGFTVSDGNLFFRCSQLLIASGGSAQVRLGGTGDGFRLLSSLGHTCIPVIPALVPLNTDRKSISGLSGLRVKCVLSLFSQDSVLLKKESGELLFTDYGVSGICVMQCSRLVISGCYLEADFLSPVFPNRRDAEKELFYRAETFSCKDPRRLLEGILNPRLSFAVLKQAGVSMRGETIGTLSKEMLLHVIDTAYRYRISDLIPRGMDQAQTSAGGASCEEFNACTMESCLIPGLFAAGEVLNVDGECGGFNLMFAFASGMIAGGYRKRTEGQV